MHGHLDIVKLLLDNTEDSSAIEAVDIDGSSALALAVAHGHRDLAKLLVEYGAGLDSADRHGMTPIFLAVNLAKKMFRSSLRVSDVDSVTRCGEISPLWLHFSNLAKMF